MCALKIAAIAAALILCPTQAIAQAAEGSIPKLYVSGYGYPQANELRGVATASDPMTWFTPADVPASVHAAAGGRTAGPNNQIILVQIGIEIHVGADDTISDCYGIYGDALLAPETCALIRQRGKFRHALSLDGTPVVGAMRMTVQYSLSGPGGGSGLPPAMMSPADAWPVVRSESRMTLASAPPPRSASRSIEDDVGVILYFNDDKPYRCQVVHMGAAEAARMPSCDFARAATYASTNPRGNGVLPMIVRWQRGKPSLIAPIRPRSQAAEPASGDDAVVRGQPNPATLAPEATAYLDIAATGQVTQCRIAKSAGTDAADVAMCKHLVQQRFRPAEDVFGQPMDSSKWVQVRFE